MKKDVKKIKIEEFNYTLPEEKIAKYPLSKRSASKLLIYKDQQIETSTYGSLSNHLPKDSFLLFNDTKVVQARLLFPKNEHTSIEVFCLEPADQMDIQQAMIKKGELEYLCLVGGARKWKNYPLEIISKDGYSLKAEKLENLGGTFRVKFSWNDKLSFSEILMKMGEIPLPPYMNRRADKNDEERYQTVFARVDGSVAAPTASLHFNESLLEDLKRKGISSTHLTLHVGAGTFKPVDSDEMEGHDMHAEEFLVNIELLETLLENVSKNIISVGTTSMRALESIYWLGWKAYHQKLKVDATPTIEQWIAYESESEISGEESLKALIHYLESNELKQLLARTSIIIAPTYNLKLAKGLITNFHQPKSTLLLLVSALIGENWKGIYQFALDNDFRFLSYGDGCLIMNENDA